LPVHDFGEAPRRAESSLPSALVADAQGGEPDPIPWYEESWTVATAGVAGVLVVGVLIYAVMQTAQQSVDPSNGPQYVTDYPTSSTTSSSRTTTTRTTTTRTTRPSTTTTSETKLDEENPFIVNPFATTTTTTTADGDDG
jgi:cytoskeletal protein RodZ